MIAEHEHTRAQRANEHYWEIVRLRGVLSKTDDKKRMLTERVTELTTSAAASAAAIEALRKENAALRTAKTAAKAATSTAMELKEENSALRAEIDRLRVRTTNRPVVDLVPALKRIAASTSRRRKLLALLHPDLLKDPALCAHAKVVREAVELE